MAKWREKPSCMAGTQSHRWKPHYLGKALFGLQALSQLPLRTTWRKQRSSSWWKVPPRLDEETEVREMKRCGPGHLEDGWLSPGHPRSLSLQTMTHPGQQLPWPPPPDPRVNQCWMNLTSPRLTLFPSLRPALAPPPSAGPPPSDSAPALSTARQGSSQSPQRVSSWLFRVPWPNNTDPFNKEGQAQPSLSAGKCPE